MKCEMECDLRCEKKREMECGNGKSDPVGSAVRLSISAAPSSRDGYRNHER
jgi:hypothetical protein